MLDLLACFAPLERVFFNGAESVDEALAESDDFNPGIILAAFVKIDSDLVESVIVVAE